MTKQCAICGAKNTWTFNAALKKQDGVLICLTCRRKKQDEEKERESYIQTKMNEVILTTTPSVDGETISEYLGIESHEVVIGSGPLSEITTSLQDFVGARSSAYENKMADAKKTVLDKLRYQAAALSGDAVIGIDMDYTEFTGNRIAIIANGTVVKFA